MIGRGTRILAGVVVGWLLAGASWADPPGLKSLEIGASAPDFALPGVDGRTYRLKDFADTKVLVVLFTCNHCPTAQAYEDRISKMHADYQDRGVRLVAISPNDPKAVRLDELGYTELSDSLEEMKIRPDKWATYLTQFFGPQSGTATLPQALDFGTVRANA
jgi:hypothetical protein